MQGTVQLSLPSRTNRDKHQYPSSEGGNLICCEGHIDRPPDQKTQDNFMHILEKVCRALQIQSEVVTSLVPHGLKLGVCGLRCNFVAVCLEPGH